MRSINNSCVESFYWNLLMAPKDDSCYKEYILDRTKPYRDLIHKLQEIGYIFIKERWDNYPILHFHHQKQEDICLELHLPHELSSI